MDLKNRIGFYKKRELLRETEKEKSLALNYLKKARNNLIATQVDYEVSKSEDVQKRLNILGFREYDWVVVKAYYSMYMAALACLARIGLKSENHEATIVALEFFFVSSGKLEISYVEALKNISLEKQYVDDLRNVKGDRINAQYSVSEEFEKRKAEESINIAKKFIDRLEKLFYEIKDEEELKKEVEKKDAKEGGKNERKTEA